MKFKDATVAEDGCGLVAIYNVRNAFGQHRNLSDIIFEFELIDSKPDELGTQPYDIYRYLELYGFEFKMTNDIIEFASWGEQGGIYLILYGCTSRGQHIAMIQYFDWLYTTYNQHNCDIQPLFEQDITAHILKGNRNAFMFGFRITGFGG
jgi:hypothetical protein